MDLSTEKISGEISKQYTLNIFFKAVRHGGGQQKQNHIISSQLGRETGMEAREAPGRSWLLPPAAHRKSN